MKKGLLEEVQIKMKAMNNNLELWEKISAEERWKCDCTLCYDEADFDKFIDDIEEQCFNVDKEMSKFEGVGYYDYCWDGYTCLIADETGIYTDEITDEISHMDEPVRIIRARKLTSQIQAYVEEYLGLTRYEYFMDFEPKRSIKAIDRLENFLTEMRKHAFVFHEEVKERFPNEEVVGFKFVYYIEAEKKDNLDFEIINAYERRVEGLIGLSRTC